MRKRIVNKLRSRTGASITFALLLFLVCAVLCSVIITAATAASGRMSQIAETDQRYYAVSSAARLLQKQIDGKTVSIVEVAETEYSTTYTAGVAGTASAGEPVTRTYIVVDKKANEIDEASDLIPGNMIGDKDFSVDSIPEDAAKRLYEYDGESVLVNNKLLSSSEGNLGKDRFALTSDFYSSAGLDYDALAVTISEDLDLDGNITLTIYNTRDTTSSAGDRYTLILPFGADRSVSTSTKTENVSSTAEDDDSKYTVKTKTTETTITTLTWHLTGIKTDS